jgi:hypothetical protein
MLLLVGLMGSSKSSRLTGFLLLENANDLAPGELALYHMLHF